MGYHRTSDKGVFISDDQLVILGGAGYVVQVRGHSVDIQVNMFKHIDFVFIIYDNNTI